MTIETICRIILFIVIISFVRDLVFYDYIQEKIEKLKKEIEYSQSDTKKIIANMNDKHYELMSNICDKRYSCDGCEYFHKNSIDGIGGFCEAERAILHDINGK